jgi:cytochrome P450
MTASLLDAHEFNPQPATPGARWLRPSAWPEDTAWLFQPRPVDPHSNPVVVSKYADVMDVMLAPDRWHRTVPQAAVPLPRRHCTLDAAWAADGDTHTLLRGSMSRIRPGPDIAARQYTRALTSRLLAGLTKQPPPWDLAPVIYGVSMRVAIEHTLRAPQLLPHIGQLRQLVRAQVTSPGGVLGIARQPEVEEILAGMARAHADLPAGLARDLTARHLAGALTRSQLAGQLGLVLASGETQATVAATLIGMLLEAGEYGYAAEAIKHREPARRLVAEGLRRGISFPATLVTAAAPATFGGQVVPAGTHALISFAAANLDPDRFGPGAVHFDPRRTGPPHVAFGAAARRCLGALSAEAFVHDILAAALTTLPTHVELHCGQLLREVAGVSWVIARLPISPAR